MLRFSGEGALPGMQIACIPGILHGKKPEPSTHDTSLNFLNAGGADLVEALRATHRTGSDYPA